MEDAGMGIIPAAIALCITLPLLAVFIWSVIWAYNDAEKRGKSGCLVALLVFLLTWPVGLIIWLLIRPEDGKFSKIS
ncbi:MAG TPA: hypothetical protein VK879_10205 [Candidatus Sulfomarinibacteraceae bacterium]|nr:hypothetical protein [Candidatus Sulfomarinibacteraceae bacterium]